MLVKEVILKKLLSIFLIFVLTTIPCFAIQEDAVWVDVKNIPLQSQLKEKYSAYYIAFYNKSGHVLKISTIQVFNKINIADTTQVCKYKKSTIPLIALGLVTFGLTSLIAMDDVSKNASNVTQAINEAQMYTPLNENTGIDLKTSMLYINNGESARFSILVPLNETPQISASFQDMTTYKFINIQK